MAVIYSHYSHESAGDFGSTSEKEIQYKACDSHEIRCLDTTTDGIINITLRDNMMTEEKASGSAKQEKDTNVKHVSKNLITWIMALMMFLTFLTATSQMLNTITFFAEAAPIPIPGARKYDYEAQGILKTTPQNNERLRELKSLGSDFLGKMEKFDNEFHTNLATLKSTLQVLDLLVVAKEKVISRLKPEQDISRFNAIVDLEIDLILKNIQGVIEDVNGNMDWLDQVILITNEKIEVMVKRF